MPVGKRGSVYNTQEWRRVCALVRERDGNRCRLADGTCRGRLTIQHVTPVRVAPHLALSPMNLVTLCASHHGREDGGRRYK